MDIEDLAAATDMVVEGVEMSTGAAMTEIAAETFAAAGQCPVPGHLPATGSSTRQSFTHAVAPMLTSSLILSPGQIQTPLSISGRKKAISLQIGLKKVDLGIIALRTS